MQSAGFLNLPVWHESLIDILTSIGCEHLLRLPVLGSENVENPWIALDHEDFFSAVQTGIHFPGKAPLRRFPAKLVTADPEVAIQRLLDGKYMDTSFSAAIGSTFAYHAIAHSPFICNKPEKILVQNDVVSGYILTKMEKEGKTLQEATHEAQWEKIASENPNFNLHGMVSKNRLVLQIADLFNVIVDPESIPTIGISVLSEEDVLIAKNLGFSIRLLGIADFVAGKVRAIVEPCMIPSVYLLAQARGGSEMIYIKDPNGSSQVFVCPGTSPESVVRGIVSDLNSPIKTKTSEPIVQKTMDNFSDSYYLRFNIVSLTDTLAQILQVFKQTGIEIENIYQPVPGVSRETPECSSHCLVLVTAKTMRNNIDKALIDIKSQVKLATHLSCFRFIRKA